MYRAILIKPSEPAEEVDVDADQSGSHLDSLQGHVGGMIQTLPWPDRDDVTCYIHEEGKILALDLNRQATDLLKPVLLPGDQIVGPMLILGFNADDGENKDAPADVAEQLLPKPLALPEPEIEKGDRSITAVWPLCATEEGEEVVTLHCYHQKDGNMMSGAPGKCFRAALTRETRETRGNGVTMRGFKMFSGIGIMSRDVERYSEKQLIAFQELAMKALQQLALDGHWQVAKQFDPEIRI